LNEAEAAQTVCPHPECRESYREHGGVVTEMVYVRHLVPLRVVDWVVAIHGMNTAGAWQEAFSWHLATTWGRSVPVAVYKYGVVITGVIMVWRRRALQNSLRDKLAGLQDQARAQGFDGKPDVIAHSFGTWLFGHLLQDELSVAKPKQLEFGRVILTGCVLRPDFDWTRIKEARLVDDVLNHYGTKDMVVPLAHAAIWDSGPSGRRGFDGGAVLNIRAEGFGHSNLFSIDQFVAKGKAFAPDTGEASDPTHLEHAYARYWRPFLTLPQEELTRIPDRCDPDVSWRQWQWPLRGAVFPSVVLPLVVAGLAWVLALVGHALWEVRVLLGAVAGIAGVGLGLLLAGIGATTLWRWLRR
jgi:hypothetical protein